mmetsp:Transcript_50669/g.133528  ORF Transcript_50669/g.133528 Transcript_50669/m.133528 type:complete len:307 (+) Transcript_50669:1027-1947(+)
MLRELHHLLLQMLHRLLCYLGIVVAGLFQLRHLPVEPHHCLLRRQRRLHRLQRRTHHLLVGRNSSSQLPYERMTRLQPVVVPRHVVQNLGLQPGIRRLPLDCRSARSLYLRKDGVAQVPGGPNQACAISRPVRRGALCSRQPREAVHSGLLEVPVHLRDLGHHCSELLRGCGLAAGDQGLHRSGVRGGILRNSHDLGFAETHLIHKLLHRPIRSLSLTNRQLRIGFHRREPILHQLLDRNAVFLHLVGQSVLHVVQILLNRSPCALQGFFRATLAPPGCGRRGAEAAAVRRGPVAHPPGRGRHRRR